MQEKGTLTIERERSCCFMIQVRQATNLQKLQMLLEQEAAPCHSCSRRSPAAAPPATRRRCQTNSKR